jgi:hypothetical protein
MTISEKEFDSMVYNCLIEELEDVGKTYTEASQKVREYIEQENL